MNGSTLTPSEPEEAGESTGLRRLPIGAEIVDAERVHLRVWAPAVTRVTVVLGRDGSEPSPAGPSWELTAEESGYFSGYVDAKVGDRYAFQLDGSEKLYPDPASRFQPDGPHGPSLVVDPAGFAWTDADWKGRELEGQVLYEMHLGTFTPEGTWEAAARQLDELAELGITVVEVMPVAEFEGRFGWGYDGVDLFAPCHLYGTPDDARRFVDRAHAAGIAVVLDVVYNHFGPVGNYLRQFAPAYFTDRYENEWGDPINFDGDDAGPVREFFVENAGYWIDEFHFDGLRLDATQQIFDKSSVNVMTAIAARVREAARGRATMLIAENEPQQSRLVRPIPEGGYGLDALWNDDFHHSAMVAVTGRAEAYYSDTRGEPQEFVSAAKYGFLYQGQHYEWQRQPRGTPAIDLPPARFVQYLQNHDQVANSARGRRGHALTSPGRWRAITALLLLSPQTPMLFQGQEFSASASFLYFADFDAELNAAVSKGRGEFLTQFPSISGFVAQASLHDPADIRTFEACRLDFAERERHAEAYTLHRDLLRLRRETAAFRAQRRGGVDGAVLGDHAFLLRFFPSEGDYSKDRVLIVNLGSDLDRPSFAEPLLAPPSGHSWHLEWSSEEPRYGGGGTADIRPNANWHIPGETAVVLAPGPELQQSERRYRRTA